MFIISFQEFQKHQKLNFSHLIKYIWMKAMNRQERNYVYGDTYHHQIYLFLQVSEACSINVVLSSYKNNASNYKNLLVLKYVYKFYFFYVGHCRTRINISLMTGFFLLANINFFLTIFFLPTISFYYVVFLWKPFQFNVRALNSI